MVAVRLERNVGCTTFCTISGLLESNRFGVDDVVVDVSSLADDLASGGDDDAADERVWRDQAYAFRGEVERTPDEGFVVRL